MAKIIKLNVYEKTVYAVQVEDNLYIDELGVKHLSPSQKHQKCTSGSPDGVRTPCKKPHSKKKGGRQAR